MPTTIVVAPAPCRLRSISNGTRPGTASGVQSGVSPARSSICFGQPSDRLRKPACLLGIYLNIRLASQTEVSLKPTMLGSSCFEDDQYVVFLTNPDAELLKTFCGVGDTARFFL